MSESGHEYFQESFFSILETIADSTDIVFCCFEAFDGYWKNWAPTEKYWGLYDSLRYPKLHMHGLTGVKEDFDLSNIENNKSRTFLLSNLLWVPRGWTGRLFNAQGRLVLNLPAGEINIALPPGVYFTVSDIKHNQLCVRKLVISR